MLHVPMTQRREQYAQGPAIYRGRGGELSELHERSGGCSMRDVAMVAMEEADHPRSRQGMRSEQAHRGWLPYMQWRYREGGRELDKPLDATSSTRNIPVVEQIMKCAAQLP